MWWNWAYSQSGINISLYVFFSPPWSCLQRGETVFRWQQQELLLYNKSYNEIRISPEVLLPTYLHTLLHLGLSELCIDPVDIKQCQTITLPNSVIGAEMGSVKNWEGSCSINLMGNWFLMCKSKHLGNVYFRYDHHCHNAAIFNQCVVEH